MFIFLGILFCVVSYLVMAGITHGYAKHRWPPDIHQRQRYFQDAGWRLVDEDDNSGNRGFSTVLWPFYWVFVWPFTKANEMTFSNMEKHAAQIVAKNKARVADLHATRAMVEESNQELAQAEAELDKEVSKSL